jgi:hypothetical protein
MIDSAFFYFIAAHLHLRSLAAINEHQVFSSLQNLRGWMPVMRRNGRIVS